ncbi:MAG TPA: hypothetical protein VGQ09_08505 [Chitinophagaceae bacterium]|jgi:hypothetical protein|nr:hypothetical protein [Chitinophagaceae bacterium]
MTGTLAQLISLVSYGNEYIAKGKLETNYYPQNSVFQFCKQVNFKTTKQRLLSGSKEVNMDNPLN